MYKQKFNDDINYNVYNNIHYMAEFARDIVLNEVQNVVIKSNRINRIESRVKSYTSTINKMIDKGYDLTLDNMIEKINDIIGIRLICNNLNDVYYLVNCIKADKEFKIITEKDYIVSPKKSGYMSYHIILQYNISTNTLTIPIKAELQIRTEEMDKWANKAHDSTYKKNKKIV